VQSSRYVAADEVRYRQIDGCGVILDLRSQRYSVLDEVATGMWACLTGEADPAAYVHRCALEFDVGVDQIVSALDEFCADCLKRGLLRPWAAAADRQHRPERRPRFAMWRKHVPSGLLALVALALTGLSLKIRGFAKTYGQQVDAQAMSESNGVPCLEPIIQPFLAAENLVLFRRAPDDCLARSLALFRYLRWRGVSATHVIGIRRVPFAAHAWVEVSGAGVLAPRPRGFSALATLTSSCR
jgi:hypothetical protein